MPASAANLAALLDFEGNFNNAMQAVMDAAGVVAFIDQQAAKIPVQNVGVSSDAGPAIDEKTLIPAPANWPSDMAPPQEYFRYPINCEYRIEVPLDANSPTVPEVVTLVGQLRGMIRAAMMLCVAPFNDVNLPFYQVSDIKPAGSNSGVIQQKNVYFCSLRFTITFEIRDSAWPTWPTS